MISIKTVENGVAHIQWDLSRVRNEDTKFMHTWICDPYLKTRNHPREKPTTFISHLFGLVVRTSSRCHQFEKRQRNYKLRNHFKKSSKMIDLIPCWVTNWSLPPKTPTENPRCGRTWRLWNRQLRGGWWWDGSSAMRHPSWVIHRRKLHELVGGWMVI